MGTGSLQPNTLSGLKYLSVHVSPDEVAASDLGAPRPDLAHELVRRWRRAHPACPILLYYPSGIRNARLGSALGGLAGVATRRQLGGSRDEALELEIFLRELIAARPELLIRALLAAVRPHPPPPISSCIEALLARLRHDAGGAPEVGALAAAAGTSVRTLRRACASAVLPGPDRLMRWLTLVYVVALMDDHALTIGQAAARAGLSESHVRTLRRSLMPEVPRLTAASAGAVLPLAITQFVAECGLPRPQAQTVVGLLSA